VVYLGKNKIMMLSITVNGFGYLTSDDYFNTYTTNLFRGNFGYAESCGYNSAIHVGSYSNSASLVVQKTSDSGDTWPLIYSNANTCVRNGPVTYLGDNRIVFLGTPDNVGMYLYFSLDGGYSWGRQHIFDDPSVAVYQVFYDIATKIYFTGKALVFDYYAFSGCLDTLPVIGVYYLPLSFNSDLSVGKNANLLILTPQVLTPLAVQGGVYMSTSGQPYICTNGTTWTPWVVEGL
jgi:hypothetical protein